MAARVCVGILVLSEEFAHSHENFEVFVTIL
jgi:hypothetical protein